jgi:hypothetical protein
LLKILEFKKSFVGELLQQSFEPRVI